MKNKKRVLTILLTIILILATFLAIVLIFGGKREKEINEFQEKMKNAGCKLAEEENYTKEICESFNYVCKIKFEQLIENGYIKGSMENPKSHKKVSEDIKSYIEVIWEDNKMTCIYNEG